MRIGVPKEIKNNENRVGITPAGVSAFIKAGHKVYIENNAGEGSGISNQEYISAGAEILNTAKEVFDIADMIIKVKEPLPEEYGDCYTKVKFFIHICTLRRLLSLRKPCLTKRLSV